MIGGGYRLSIFIYWHHTMYTHISSEGRKIQVPYQAKNAIEHTIKKTEEIKNSNKRERREQIWVSVDKHLTVSKQSSFMPKAPRK